MNTMDSVMFQPPRKLIELHRNIEKLPKVQRFLTSKERGSMYRNLGYKTSLTYFHQFLVTKYGATLETIIDLVNRENTDVYELLDQFVVYLESMTLSRSSVNQYLCYVKSYLQYHDIDIVPHKFKKRVVMPKIPREDERPIDQDDIRTILLKCPYPRLKTFLLVLASSGVRPTEGCAIRVRDCNFNESPTRIHIRAEYTKTKRSRDIYISDEASSYLSDWIKYNFGVDLKTTKKIDEKIENCLVFQVQNIGTQNITPQSIYRKFALQFPNVLDRVGFSQRKDGMRRRQITLHSFRRFVKTTISDSPAGTDYSEWFLGHNKSSYYVSKPAARAEIYATKCMKYLTFLEYSTLEATGKSLESRINEFEKEKQMMSQKHEEEMKTLHEQMDRIIEMIQYNPKLARIKRDVLMTRQPINK